jgi:hypothetical protein
MKTVHPAKSRSRKNPAQNPPRKTNAAHAGPETLSSGDVTEPEGGGKRLLGWVFRTLSKEFRHVNSELIAEAVTAAFRHYWNCPQDFKASRGVPLEYYLLFAASRKLSKMLQRIPVAA